MNQIPASKPSIDPVQQLPLDEYLRLIYPNFFSEYTPDWVSSLLLRKAVTPTNNCSISISKYNTPTKIKQRLQILKDKHYFHAQIEFRAINECGSRALNYSRASDNYHNLDEFSDRMKPRVTARFGSITSNLDKVEDRRKRHREFCNRYKVEIILLEHLLQNCVKSVNLMSFFEISDQEEDK